jgi:hypothetical protein
MTLPVRVSDWTGHEIRYCHNPDCRGEFSRDELADPAVCPRCGGPLFAMSAEERDALPPDTAFAKARYDKPNGVALFVSIVMSGKDSGSIHRPQACLVGQGLRIVGNCVVPVTMAGRPPLAIMVLDLMASPRVGPRDRTPPWQGRFGYWFVGQGRETPYDLVRVFWQYWDRLVRGVSHRWAYVGVMSGWQADASRSLSDMREFIAAFYPQVVIAGGDSPAPNTSRPASQ